ncbi:rabankyrin-5-like [Haemaphysalis longicornis]
MASSIDRLRKTRGILRSGVTRSLNQLKDLLQQPSPDAATLSSHVDYTVQQDAEQRSTGRSPSAGIDLGDRVPSHTGVSLMRQPRSQGGGLPGQPVGCREEGTIAERWLLLPCSHSGAEKQNAPSLHIACYSGIEGKVKNLASNGMDLEEEDRNGDRPIHYASCGNEPGIITLLLSLGVDINARNKKNRTALHIAVDKKFVDCVRVLVGSPQLDVNIQDHCGNTPCHYAVRNGLPTEALHMLLKHLGADLTIEDDEGSNVLHTAAMGGHNCAVEQILLANPDLLNIKQANGWAALHIAASRHHFHVVKTLLSQHLTPLMVALLKGHCQIVERLVEAGAEINTADIDGNSAMQLT